VNRRILPQFAVFRFLRLVLQRSFDVNAISFPNFVLDIVMNTLGFVRHEDSVKMGIIDNVSILIFVISSCDEVEESDFSGSFAYSNGAFATRPIKVT